MANDAHQFFVLTFPGDDELKVEKLLECVKEELSKHGLLVKKDSDLPDSKKCSGDRFIVVSAKQKDIEIEAEHLRLRKLTKKKVHGRPDIAQFEIAEKHSLEPFTAGERSDIIMDMIESVEMTSKVQGLMKGCSSEKYAKEARSLVLGLKMGGLIELCEPLHNDGLKKEIWKHAFKKILCPIEEIGAYFGSEIAFYFAWMNFSTKWYIIPGFAGLAVWLYGQLSSHTVDDNPYVPIYSLFVVFWAVSFIQYWRREQVMWAYRFGTVEGNPAEIERAQFEGHLEISEVTGKPQRYYPYKKRLVSYFLSVLVTVAMLGVAFLVMVCSLNLQGYIQDDTTFERFFYIERISKYAEPGALFDPNGANLLLTLVPTILHVLTIMQLNNLYRLVAEWLTDGENHRLEHEHENALIFKRVFFEAFDCYIALFYIAFFQFDVVRLRVELVQMYTTDSLRRVGVEALLPILVTQLTRLTKRKPILTPMDQMRKQDSMAKFEALSAPSVEDEMDLAEYEQFDDYLEMVIQFGYVTLFASAFPLASFLSLLCNLVEMKSDLFKLCWVYRRPRPRPAQDIGTWESVMWAFVGLAVLTNCMIFTFSSEQMMQWLPFMFVEDENSEQDFAPAWARVGYSLCFTLEHLIFLLAGIFLLAIPDTPEWVATKLKKFQAGQARLAHEARVARRQAVQRKFKEGLLNETLDIPSKQKSPGVELGSTANKQLNKKVNSIDAAARAKQQQQQQQQQQGQRPKQKPQRSAATQPGAGGAPPAVEETVEHEEGDEGFQVVENSKARRRRRAANRTGVDAVLGAMLR